MIINGNYYQQTTISTGNESANEIDSPLVSHMKENIQAAKNGSDSVSLSEEAYAALKEYAPEALSALGIDKENPVMEEVKQIAKEKYFHFGSEYITVPETKEEMLSALDVANRYMDALNSITPDDISEAIANANYEGAGSSLGTVDIYSARTYLEA
jgi:hypothetical protein